MTLPYVTDVSRKDGQIVLTIELEKYLAGESVEISGSATQANGAFANFYDIQSANVNPAGKLIMFVKANPARQFHGGEAVTVVLRASRVWTTVLTLSPNGQMPVPLTGSPQPVPAAEDGTIGNIVTAVEWAAPIHLPPSNTSQKSAGSDSNFPNKSPAGSSE